MICRIWVQQHWARTIREIKRLNPQTTIEVLIPDFQGRMELVDLVIEARPDIISHNMETVRRISPLVRSAANYDTSCKSSDTFPRRELSLKAV